MGACWSPTSMERNESQRFKGIVKSAVCEWLLIFMLLIDSVLSYVITRFARYCGLQAPCMMCSRLDHVLGNEKPQYYWNLICRQHRFEFFSLFTSCDHNTVSESDSVAQFLTTEPRSCCAKPCSSEEKGSKQSSPKSSGYRKRNCKPFIPLPMPKHDKVDGLKNSASVSELDNQMIEADDGDNSLFHNTTERKEELLVEASDNSTYFDGQQRDKKLPNISLVCDLISIDSDAPLSSRSQGLTFSEDSSPSKSDSNNECEFTVNTETEGFTASASEQPWKGNHETDIERSESGLASSGGGTPNIIEGESAVDRLKRQIELQKRYIDSLYKELEEERSASAIAADESMAMMTKLREEKATLHMEVMHYLRMSDEQAENDAKALEEADELLAEKEKEIEELEAELGFYRCNSADKLIMDPTVVANNDLKQENTRVVNNPVELQ